MYVVDEPICYTRDDFTLIEERASHHTGTVVVEAVGAEVVAAVVAGGEGTTAIEKAAWGTVTVTTRTQRDGVPEVGAETDQGGGGTIDHHNNNSSNRVRSIMREGTVCLMEAETVSVRCFNSSDSCYCI